MRRISFGIDSGAIDTLVFVAGRCRDPLIRQEAIDLLIQTDRTEGDLHGSTGSLILQKLVELEEDGAEITSASDILEDQCLRIWEDHQYWDAGSINVFFVKWPYNPIMGAEVRKASI